MRIKSIRLAWFRGAADPVALDANNRSVVIYGQNGAGKSSFVDAIEYVLRKGNISHLAHEYSGKHQKFGVRNTHIPKGRDTEFWITFEDDSILHLKIAPNGTHTRTGAEAADIDSWEYRRTVLRQDEVAEFIKSPKGEKYSALLPLFGLEELETAADNLRRLSTTIREDSLLKERETDVRMAMLVRKQQLEDKTDDGIEAKIAELREKYCPQSHSVGSLDRSRSVRDAIAARIDALSSESMRHMALRGAADATVAQAVKGVRESNAKLAGSAEQLAERIDVLRGADTFIRRVEKADEVACPACGQKIPVAHFKAHIESEQERLKKIRVVYDERKAAIGALIDQVKSLKKGLAKMELGPWLEEQKRGPLKVNTEWLENYDAEGLRDSVSELDLNAIEEHCLPLIGAAAHASQTAPPSVKELSRDQLFAVSSAKVLGAKASAAELARIKCLIAFLNSLEAGVREEIRQRSEAIIAEISADIKSMWQALHPTQLIDQVRLYLPQDDKAIDIALRFHGKDQDSPRLTLSEGYRNSLGLCIFLALAKREASKDRPLFLDDVVVSLDRNHRGMILQLLEQEFANRQVILLTHDRDWFAELRQQLDEKRWTYRMLLPWDGPLTGIRWSHKATSFDDARAHLADRPDSAGNDARKIMDIELAIAAEKLQVRLPYVRGDRNDKRMAHDFFERLIADGKKCFQKRAAAGEHTSHTNAFDALDEAHRLLLSWGNKSSHSFDVVRPEAARLIDASEKALEVFRCSTCTKPVWFADARGAELVQCECGELRWRYGRG